ncbi:hypothetical protein EVAR_74696_1 [Eumeta japonica]|uniref:Mariner Mos1 transposase n=1 Tax=Eumeta variegata TaxID=151549 RepID=A0A4C1YMW1_EUMVA|nr:hypothetical protein EVAR_74696_1 [Eumeta japonica]
MNRVLICDYLDYRFDYVRKIPWSKGKHTLKATPGSTRNELVLCVGMVGLEGYLLYIELLPPGKTIYSDLYCQQLTRLKQEEKKHPELINRKCGFSP